MLCIEYRIAHPSVADSSDVGYEISYFACLECLPTPLAELQISDLGYFIRVVWV